MPNAAPARHRPARRPPGAPVRWPPGRTPRRRWPPPSTPTGPNPSMSRLSPHQRSGPSARANPTQLPRRAQAQARRNTSAGCSTNRSRAPTTAHGVCKWLTPLPEARPTRAVSRPPHRRGRACWPSPHGFAVRGRIAWLWSYDHGAELPGPWPGAKGTGQLAPQPYDQRPGQGHQARDRQVGLHRGEDANGAGRAQRDEDDLVADRASDGEIGQQPTECAPAGGARVGTTSGTLRERIRAGPSLRT